MINTPLASTAVGVVTVDRSGMASGINSTFRQVGIATGIAVLGTIFAHQVADGVRTGLAGTPAADQSDRIAAGVTGGQTEAVIQAAPAGVRDQLAAVATSSFVDALNHITLIAMVRGLRRRGAVLRADPAAGLRRAGSRRTSRPLSYAWGCIM